MWLSLVTSFPRVAFRAVHPAREEFGKICELLNPTLHLVACASRIFGRHILCKLLLLFTTTALPPGVEILQRNTNYVARSSVEINDRTALLPSRKIGGRAENHTGLKKREDVVNISNLTRVIF